MCIAIYKPAGAWATKEQLRTSYEANPHGAGFALHDGEQVKIFKGFFSWRSFWKMYRKHVKTDTPALAHFRIATKGSKTAENCHPFLLGNGALMHNGPCLNYMRCSGEGDRSDSRQFAEDFIYGLESWQVQRILPMIENFIGSEKVVMLFDDGEVVIANEKNGHWAHGCWWSNHSYEGKRNVISHSSSPIIVGDDEDEEGLYDWKRWAQWEPRTTERVSYIWDTTLNQSIPKFLRIEATNDICRWNAALRAYVPLELYDAEDELIIDETSNSIVILDDRGVAVDVCDRVMDTEDLKLILAFGKPVSEYAAYHPFKETTADDVTAVADLPIH